MNHELWKATGARVVALLFVVAGAAACDRGDRNEVRQPAAASPSAVVVGTLPAEPNTSKPDTAQVTPPPAAQGEVSKQADSTKRPLEGDDSSHSTLAPVTPQKADGVNPTRGNNPPK